MKKDLKKVDKFYKNYLLAKKSLKGENRTNFKNLFL